MSRFNRRDFLRAGSILAAGALLPPAVSAYASRGDPAWSRWDGPINDPALKQIALRAVEAARAAGALYADARLSRIRRRVIWVGSSWGMGPYGTRAATAYPVEHEALAIGVRALVNGYWGFAASVAWTADEAARLGREAVGQAKTSALGRPRAVELGAVPVVADGHWVMPVERDPFTVPSEEIQDLLSSPFFLSLLRWRDASLQMTIARRETAFASSDGSYATQILFRTGGSIGTQLRWDERVPRPPSPGQPYMGRDSAQVPFPMAGRGWEHFSRISLQDEIERAIAEADEEDTLPLKPLEVGRYDVVFDAGSAGRLLDGTIGAATELDRAMGYEANAVGISYLDDPVAMLGTHQIGAPMLTVSADRSMPGGAATVKWDEEGVAPQDFTLVKDGVLVDFQTTRESAGWLREAYAKANRSAGSHACSGSTSAMGVQQLQRPNLRLAPATGSKGFDELVADMKRGVAVKGAAVEMDFNALNGMVIEDPQGSRTVFFEVKGGKKVARFQPKTTSVVVRAPELWKNLLALGGPGSLARIGGTGTKGEPAQTSHHTVEAPPMLVKQLALVDPAR
jgi:TldD protein